MDKSDWALAVAIAAAMFTGWQAWSAHVTAAVARASVRRPDPVFETTVKPVPRMPGWHSVRVRVRNQAECRAEVLKVSYRSFMPRLVGRSDILYDDGFSAHSTRLDALDEVIKRRSVTIGKSAPAASELRLYRALSFEFYAFGTIRVSRLRYDWRWLDGRKS